MQAAVVVRRALRLLAVALLLLFLVLLARHFHAVALIGRGAELARAAGPAGVAAVFGGVVVLTLLLLPMVPLVMACGWIYGMAGAAVSLPAATVSAALAFLIGRALGHTRLQSALVTRPKLRAVAELAEKGGVITVALLRVSPILPFTPSNAVLGMTRLRLRDLIAGTFVGILPGGLLYTSVGSFLPDPEALERGELPPGPFWALLGLGIVSMAVIATAATRKLRQIQRA